MDTKELAKWVANNRLSVNGALLAKSTQDAIISALELAAAVEGAPECTPETDANVRWTESAGDHVGYGFACDLESRLLAALRALKAERERVAQFESERLPFPVLIRDTNFGKGVKVGTMLGCLKRHIEWNKPDIGPDAALAAQEGRT